MSATTSRSRITPDGDVPLSTAVTEAIQARTETALTELPPLYDAIDPDALNAMFSGRRTDGWVKFRYAGHVVTVHADRTVEIS